MNDFVVPTERVSYGAEGQYGLEVRGLSYQDFTSLFTQFGQGLDQLFKLIEGGTEPTENFDLKEFGTGLAVKSPQLVAQLIALAADEPDRATQVARMPLPVQIKCLETIYKLTVEETGGFANFLQLVLKIAQEVRITARAMNPNVPTTDIGS